MTNARLAGLKVWDKTAICERSREKRAHDAGNIGNLALSLPMRRDSKVVANLARSAARHAFAALSICPNAAWHGRSAVYAAARGNATEARAQAKMAASLADEYLALA